MYGTKQINYKQLECIEVAYLEGRLLKLAVLETKFTTKLDGINRSDGQNHNSNVSSRSVSDIFFFTLL